MKIPAIQHFAIQAFADRGDLLAHLQRMSESERSRVRVLDVTPLSIRTEVKLSLTE